MSYMSTVDELKVAGRKIAAAQKQLDEAKAVAKELAIRAHWEEDVWETTITELLGVHRMTVRRWLGKRDSKGELSPRKAKE